MMQQGHKTLPSTSPGICYPTLGKGGFYAAWVVRDSWTKKHSSHLSKDQNKIGHRPQKKKVD